MLSFNAVWNVVFIRFGRRIPYCTFMLVGGVAGLLVLAVPEKPGMLILTAILVKINNNFSLNA